MEMQGYWLCAWLQAHVCFFQTWQKMTKKKNIHSNLMKSVTVAYSQTGITQAVWCSQQNKRDEDYMKVQSYS